MEPSKEAIALRLNRLNRHILGKTAVTTNFNKRTIDREALLDALTVLYDECNDDPIKKTDDLVRAFVDKYRSTLAELRRIRVCIADFDMLHLIGKGYFGDVHMVREKQTADVYAMKVLRKEATSKRYISAVDERDVLAASNSPWLPKLQYAFQDNTSLYLVMELCPGGDLAGFLSRRDEPLCERDAAFYVAEIAHALRVLHNLGFVHRDVKPHNVLLDRCGHVKLSDFGSSARLSSDCAGAPPASTADYLSPELLALSHCAATHRVCLDCARGVAPTPITACDYWSLGVIAFELVTLKRPFSGEDDSVAVVLNNIQKYESKLHPEPPFPPLPEPPTQQWRSLVAGLLRTRASKRFHYLDTLQHVALSHLSPHSIRDQAPPWVPVLHGQEDASHFGHIEREPGPVTSAPFRTRVPFHGDLPYVGFSYVALDETDDSLSSGFNASHDCTAINLATFKSAEKLAALRGREIASLQTKLAEAEALAGAEAERSRLAAEDEAEKQRARLQAEITALSLQNRRLERQIEIDKDERMALERSNQELKNTSKRSTSELQKLISLNSEFENEKKIIKDEKRKLEQKVAELQSECERAHTALQSAQVQQKHYKDSIAKERALRRQTLNGCEADTREVNSRLIAAEANVLKETRARDEIEKKLAECELNNRNLQIELDITKKELNTTREQLNDKRRTSEASTDELKQLQLQLSQELVRSSTLLAQVQELQKSIEKASNLEVALEEQRVRTEVRLKERLEAAEANAAEAAQEEARHREKVRTLEQLVHKLEREVRAVEAKNEQRKEVYSDTESVGEPDNMAINAQLNLMKDQIHKHETQLQARAEEIAALRQEARAANLARWRKEREFNELSIELKGTAREIKRLEERLASSSETRKKAESKIIELQNELNILRPSLEANTKELESTKSQLQKLLKSHEVLEAEVDRSRNDIRKLKSELQYSEKRRIRAEQQEELGSKERSQLRDEATSLRSHATHLEQNTKTLQETCTLLEEQLTDLERLSDVHELKYKELEKECETLKLQLKVCNERLAELEKLSSEKKDTNSKLEQKLKETELQLERALAEITELKERLEAREERICSLEALSTQVEGDKKSIEAALNGALRQLRAIQEECASLRTRAAQHHGRALELQAGLAAAQEELAANREAAEAATAWWRTRETKADGTLRQQAKLIDFLQAKIEETKHKKSSLGNKLFGRSGRRTVNSPPMRVTNRELREEMEKLRTKLATTNGVNHKNPYSQPTPQKEPSKVNGHASIDVPDYELWKGPKSQHENTTQIVWPNGTRDEITPYFSDGYIIFNHNGTQIKGKLLSAATDNLPHNEANRAFTIKLISHNGNPRACIVWSTQETRAAWLARLTGVTSQGEVVAEWGREIWRGGSVMCGLVVGDMVLMGGQDGLYSVRCKINLRLDSKEITGSVTALELCGSRIYLVCNNLILHCALIEVSSAAKRSPSLCPSIDVVQIQLPEKSYGPYMIKASSVVGSEALCVSAGRRVYIVSGGEWCGPVVTSRVPAALLLLRSLYVAADGCVWSTSSGAGSLVSFVELSAAPLAVLVVRVVPLELLVCTGAGGVLVDASGRRTRDGPRWPPDSRSFVYVRPCVYAAGARLHVTLLTDDTSPAAAAATLPLVEPVVLAAGRSAALVRSLVDGEHVLSLVDGVAALRNFGASVESLASLSDDKHDSSAEASRSPTDASPASSRESSYDDAERPSTKFLASIRRRAQQLRKMNRMQSEQPADDVIKAILTSEVGPRNESMGRMSPARCSDSSDSDYDDAQNKSPSDVCAEMFARQVRFQS